MKWKKEKPTKRTYRDKQRHRKRNTKKADKNNQKEQHVHDIQREKIKGVDKKDAKFTVAKTPSTSKKTSFPSPSTSSPSSRHPRRHPSRRPRPYPLHSSSSPFSPHRILLVSSLLHLQSPHPSLFLIRFHPLRSGFCFDAADSARDHRHGCSATYQEQLSDDLRRMVLTRGARKVLPRSSWRST